MKNKLDVLSQVGLNQESFDNVDLSRAKVSCLGIEIVFVGRLFLLEGGVVAITLFCIFY